MLPAMGDARSKGAEIAGPVGLVDGRTAARHVELAERRGRHGKCRERVEAAERFDEGALGPELVARYLRDLEKVNRYLYGARSVLAEAGPLLAERGRGTFLALDIGCGGGEILRALARRARAERRPFRGIGLDRNRLALAYARERARGFPELTWVCADALAPPFPPQTFDLVVSTTLLHHLAPGQATRLLQGARLATHGGLIVSDLVRSYAGVLGFQLFSRLAGFCEASRQDGLISIGRAYRPRELAELAAAAGLRHCRVRRYPCCRMALVCGPEGEDAV